MLPSLIGIIASSGGAAAGGDYESIATVTVGSGGASTVTFSSIPSTYQHLQIRIMAKTGSTNYFGEIAMNINGGAGEQRHDIYGTGSGVGASAAATDFVIYTGNSSNFGVGIVDILDYADTNKTRTSRALCGLDGNGSGLVALTSGLDTTTSAVSTLNFVSTVGNFAQYSSFALYGIKG